MTGTITTAGIRRQGRCAFRIAMAVLVVSLAAANAVASDNQPCVPGLVPDVLVYSEFTRNELQAGQYAIIVEKQTQQLYLFTYQGRWRLEDRWPCSTGKRPGRKQREGDYKTPEGIYFVTRMVPARFLEDTYGSCALPLDYPNPADLRARRSGSAIWIHGTNKTLLERDSNGCVVLDNRSIEALARRVRPYRTPVIIVPRLRWWTQQKADAVAMVLMDAVDRWCRAMTGGSYADYRGWYAPSSAPSMKWWHRWCRVRHFRASYTEPWRLRVADRDILKFEDELTIRFDLHLETPGGSVRVGRRELVVANVEGRMCIVGDTYASSRESTAKVAAGDPLFAAWRTLNAKETQQAALKGAGDSDL